MFSFVIVLTLASFLFEMLLAAKIPSWRQNAKKYKMFNLIISVFLSFIMGVLFGAAGLIVMTAAILSTLLSIPGYTFLYWCFDSPQAKLHGGNQYDYYKKQFVTVISDFIKLIYKILRIITFPIWGSRALMNKYKAFRS